MLLDRFLPPDELTDPVQRRRGHLLAVMLLIPLALLVVFMATYAIYREWLMLISATLFTGLFGLLLASYRRLGTWRSVQILLSAGTLQIAILTLFTGGLYSFTSPYFAVLPMVALTMLDRRWGLIWGGIGAVAVALFFGIESAGLTPPPVLQLENIALTTTANLLVLLLYCGGMVLFLQSLNDMRFEQLNEHRTRAEAACEAKSSFLANMSHELRTPLNGILGLTEAMRDGGKLPAEEAASLELVLRSGRGLAQLLDDLLDFSKLEAGRVELEALPVSVAEAIADVLGLFSERASKRQVTLTRRCDPGIGWGKGDPGRLRQVLLNLVGNAVKFTSNGTVEVHARRDGDHVLFAVTDNGVGISADQQARLFEPFVQADGSITRRFGGSGLGLSISRRLVQRMGGTITLESRLGAGSTFAFSVRLPVCAPPAVPKKAAQESALPDGLRVLVAEDNLINQHVVRRLLEPQGITVTVADDGEAAIAAAEAARPDIVLMDIHMPVLDGLAATRALRAAGFSLPIIVLSASAFREDREAAALAGADDFLSKPIDARALFSAIARNLSEQAA